MKLTFRKDKKPTGLSSIGYPYPATYIKIDNKIIGWISPPTWQTKDVWKIIFSVKKSEPDDNPNCDWKNITLLPEFTSEPGARDFIKQNIEKITEKYVFHTIGDE